MNASSRKKAVDLVAKATPANPQVQAAAMAESQQLQSLPLSALLVDDSRPPQVTYDYDREHDRILNSVCHRLDLGPNMLPGAQQHTTVESAAALTIQDKIEGKYDENIHSINGQYRNEMYKRAENMVPQ